MGGRIRRGGRQGTSGPFRGAAVLVALLMGTALLAACGDDDSGDGASPDGELPRLDLDTLAVEAEGVALEAVRYEGSFVAEVTDELFVGVSFPEGVGPGQPVMVYLCDDVHGEWLTGLLDSDGEVSLENEEVMVALDLGGDRVTGSAAWRGDEPRTFTAYEATGDAGLYGAWTTHDEVEHSAGWVVLDDGRQRGYLWICPPQPIQVCLLNRP